MCVCVGFLFCLFCSLSFNVACVFVCGVYILGISYCHAPVHFCMHKVLCGGGWLDPTGSHIQTKCKDACVVMNDVDVNGFELSGVCTYVVYYIVFCTTIL